MPGMQVEEIALVNIVLRRWDGARIWYPTTSIISIPLLNLTRSNNKWEFFQVDILSDSQQHHTCQFQQLKTSTISDSESMWALNMSKAACARSEASRSILKELGERGHVLMQLQGSTM